MAKDGESIKKNEEPAMPDPNQANEPAQVDLSNEVVKGGEEKESK